MRPYKRVRVREVWIDWHPGVKFADERRRLLPGDTAPVEGPVIVIPDDNVTHPDPDFVADPAKQCITTPIGPLLMPNLLTGKSPTQWCQLVLGIGTEPFPRRFTNGRADHAAINLLSKIPNSPVGLGYDIDRSIIYTFETPKSVEALKFWYTALGASTATNFIPNNLSTYPVAIGPISVTLRDSTGANIGRVRFHPSENPSTSTDFGFDSCPVNACVKLDFDRTVSNVKSLSILLKGAHYGLVEIEAFGVPPEPPIPNGITWINTSSTTPFNFIPTVARTATYSHTNPITNVLETGTKFFASNFNELKNGTLNDNPNLTIGTGHSGSTPYASWWVTLGTATDISKLRFYGFHNANNQGVIQPTFTQIEFYATDNTLTKTIVSNQGNLTPYVVGTYTRHEYFFPNGDTLAAGVKHIRFVHTVEQIKGIWEFEIDT